MFLRTGVIAMQCNAALCAASMLKTIAVTFAGPLEAPTGWPPFSPGVLANMTATLHGIRLKINRAKKHLDEFDTVFLSDPSTVATNVNLESIEEMRPGPAVGREP